MDATPVVISPEAITEAAEVKHVRNEGRRA